LQRHSAPAVSKLAATWCCDCCPLQRTRERSFPSTCSESIRRTHSARSPGAFPPRTFPPHLVTDPTAVTACSAVTAVTAYTAVTTLTVYPSVTAVMVHTAETAVTAYTAVTAVTLYTAVTAVTACPAVTAPLHRRDCK
jgi:hypothetical protein